MYDVTAFYFEWPWALGLLLLIPVLIWVYAAYQHRQWREALQFSYTAVLSALPNHAARWKRLVIPITVVGVLCCQILTVARPTVVREVPVRAVEMMLVLDISLSMMAEDIAPNRLYAARDAAIRFVESLPREARVGLELFAGNTYVVTPPTGDHRKVLAYLKNLDLEDLQTRTEIGSALQAGLKALNALPTTPEAEAGDAPEPEEQAPERVIVLLSDGDSREGYPWDKAAQNAKDQRVMIFTVGIGSHEPTTIVYQNQTLPVSFSEETLRRIAEIADGQYFRVAEEADFQGIYQRVRDQSLVMETRTEELGGWVSLLGLWVLLVGMGLSMGWVRLFKV
jgi:Ca-activated chloride channel family protein